MRSLSQPVRTYAETLTSGAFVEPSQVLPNFGPINGITLDFSVTLAGATASQTSNSIDNLISNLAIDDQYGKSILDALGTDLKTLNDILQPRGVRTSPPTVTTDATGAGSASWKVFFPLTIGSGDMPAIVKLTWAAKSVLQNAGLVNAGTVTVNLVLRASYDTLGNGPTLRIKASSPPHQAGDNSVGPYLPQGFELQSLAFTLANDAALGYLTVMHAGASFASLMPANDFVDADVMLMQSGHLSGEFITRFPVWTVDSTTVVTINLAVDSAIRLFSIATVPQKRD